jgi:hypothetical protein
MKWQRRYTYTKGVDIQSSFLTNDDFDMLEIWCSILKDFKLLCLAEEGNATLTTQGTAARVIAGITCIHERLMDAETEVRSLDLANEFAIPFLAGIREAVAKTLKYTNLIKQSPIYYAAIILNPNLRLLWFEDHWAKYDGRKWYNRAAKGMQRFFDDYVDKLSPPSSQPSQVDIIESEPEDIDRTNYYAKFSKLSTNVVRKKRKLASKEDDYTRYIKYWDAAAWQEVDDIIEWWNQHRNEYPILSRMAFDVLSVPGMSAEVERIFSQAGRLITDARNGLSDNAIEACQVQHHGLKSGLFNVR